VAYNVARRTSEIGIRMALGAQRGRLVWMVLREVLMLAGIGIAASVTGALAASKLVESFLFGMRPNDLGLSRPRRRPYWLRRGWRGICRHGRRPGSIRWWRCGTSRMKFGGRARRQAPADIGAGFSHAVGLLGIVHPLGARLR
jgi:hypothetical protein